MKELLFKIESTTCFSFLRVNTPVNGAQFQLDLKRYSNISLRSKRFQSSYCAKVRAEAKKKKRWTRAEMLATQAILI